MPRLNYSVAPIVCGGFVLGLCFIIQYSCTNPEGFSEGFQLYFSQ